MANRTAAVCLAGHFISGDVVNARNRLEDLSQTGSVGGINSFGQRNRPITEVQKFCGTCGAPVITACTGCDAQIPLPNYLGGAKGPNAFCIGRGQPFQWATRQQMLGKLRSYLEFEEGADATLKPPWVCAPAGAGAIFSQVSGPWERMAAS